MAAPSFVSSASGATDAGGAWTFTPSWSDSTQENDIVILQVLQDGSTGGAVTLTSVGIAYNDLAGTDGALTFIGVFNVGSSTAALQHLWIGRLVGGGAPAISGDNSTSEDLYIRMYAFRDVATGTTLATVIENSTAGNATNGVGTDATALDTAVTTLGPDRLALNFVAVNDDNAISAFTSETGGDWTLAVSPYADSGGTDGAIGLQAATITSAGTINGGSGSIVDSDAWGVVGFALIGTTVVSTEPARPEKVYLQAVNRSNVY